MKSIHFGPCNSFIPHYNGAATHHRQTQTGIRTEEGRLQTFQGLPRGDLPYPLNLVRCGFHSTRNGDEVRCCDCLVKVSGWCNKQYPYIEHYRLNKRCKYSRLIGKLASRVSRLKAGEIFSKHTGKSFDFTKMVSSFEGREYLYRQTPTDFANAGLHYIGPDDRVKCDICEIVLKKWEPCDIPAIEHFLWSPSCVFAKMLSQEIEQALSDTSMSFDEMTNDASDENSRSKSDTSTNVERKFKMQETSYSTNEALTMVNSHSKSYISTNAERKGEMEGTGNSTRNAEKTTPQTSFVSKKYPFETNEKLQDSKLVLDRLEKACNTETDENERLQEMKDQIDAVSLMDFDRHVVEKFAMDHFKTTGNNYDSAEDLYLAITKTDESEVCTKKIEGCENLEKCPKEETPKTTENNLDQKNRGLQSKYPEIQSNMDNFTEDERWCCKICLVNPLQITFQPCGHLVTCKQCAESVETCPICRSAIGNSIHTYIP